MNKGFVVIVNRQYSNTVDFSVSFLRHFTRDCTSQFLCNFRNCFLPWTKFKSISPLSSKLYRASVGGFVTESSLPLCNMTFDDRRGHNSLSWIPSQQARHYKIQPRHSMILRKINGDLILRKHLPCQNHQDGRRWISSCVTQRPMSYENRTNKFLASEMSVSVVVRRWISRKDYVFPELLEDDLVESFMRGSGPGGQAVAKTNNCVLLRHKPTGIQIKVHESRSLERNREIAREKLIEKLDRHINGENCFTAQQQRERAKANEKKKKKRAVINEKMKIWKESLKEQNDSDITQN